METMQIIGRRSSLFTRMALIFAEEFAVAHEFVPIYDMKDLDAQAYAGHPALKLPILRRGDATLFGTQNICRALAEHASVSDEVAWPESMRDDMMCNAQELVWHCMSAQVQLLMGTVVARLPTDNLFFVKLRTGVEGSLGWLDAHLDAIVEQLPAQRRLSVFEVSLFCLIEHLSWRSTVSLDGFAELARFSATYAARPSSARTSYAFDVPPEAATR
jgi:glutathione S-transferase